MFQILNIGFVYRALSGEDINPPLDSPLSDDEMGILDQPLKMVRCLHDEKNVAVARCEVLETQLQSLTTQLKETGRKSIEFQVKIYYLKTSRRKKNLKNIFREFHSTGYLMSGTRRSQGSY